MIDPNSAYVMINELKPEMIWNEIWYKSDAPELLVKSFWKQIQKAYTSKGRYYHILSHIGQMLYSSSVFEDKIEDLQNLKFAIFYHDFVYSATRKNNEEKSAEMAVKHLTKLNYRPERIEKCCSFILATKSHSNHTKDNDLNFFLDFDLEKLGGNWEEYQNYAAQIRLEYSIYPDLIYKQGRKRVLEYFLKLEKIYHSREFYNLYEIQARHNLKRELDMLG